MLLYLLLLETDKVRTATLVWYRMWCTHSVSYSGVVINGARVSLVEVSEYNKGSELEVETDLVIVGMRCVSVLPGGV